MFNTKKNIEEKEKVLTELISQAQDHPLMKKIIEEKQAEVLAKRKEVTLKIDGLRRERDEASPKLQSDLAMKEEQWKKAKLALDFAQMEFQKARAALSFSNLQFNNQIQAQENILRETADPRIDEGIRFFFEKLDYLRSPQRLSLIAAGSERNIFSETLTMKEETNAPAVLAAIQYCMVAIGELEGMKLTPSLDLEKIEQMKAGIPSTDEYTEFTGSKPLPGSKPIRHRSSALIEKFS